MSKLYDRLEWAFLKEMMERISFANSWVDLIMRCIIFVSYSVIVNGKVDGTFIPFRGLRQGDPLSLFFFLYAMRGYRPL